MNKAIKDGLLFAIVGAITGVAVGVLAASTYVVIKRGGKFADVVGLEIFEYAPWNVGVLREPFETGLMITAVASVIGMIAFIALSYRPNLTSHGSAKWATKEDLRKANIAVRLNHLSGPIYAKLGSPKSRGEFITSHDIPHSFICAPTGSGKGVGVVIPTLLTYGGSVICLDVKGENYRITASARKALGDKVYRFSPLDENNRSHRFNPLDGLANLPSERRYTEAQRIAESFIVMSGDNVQGFLVSAKQIFAATALVAIELETPTMAAIHDILSEGGDFNKMFEKLAKQTEIEEAKSIYQRMAGIADRTLSAYMSVLFDGGLGIWRDGLVRAATETSDFRIDDLRRTPASIYIVVAPNDLAVLAPVIRLLFQQAVSVLQSTEPGLDEPYPVLFLLDEFPQLGKMPALSNAISTIRSYGGRMMIVAQTLSNLRGTYGPEGAQNFLANCRVQLFMAPADSDTPDYVSKAIGDFTRKSRSKSWTLGQIGKSNIQEREEGARLLRPEDLRNLSAKDTVILVQGSDPILAQKVIYYEDRFLQSILSAHEDDILDPQELAVRSAKISMLSKPSEQELNEEISKEDFQSITNKQSSLLNKIRKTRSEISTS